MNSQLIITACGVFVTILAFALTLYGHKDTSRKIKFIFGLLIVIVFIVFAYVLGFTEEIKPLQMVEDPIPDKMKSQEAGLDILSEDSRINRIWSDYELEKLSADWWIWALSMPVNRHPLYDTAQISEGQSGNVWFLGTSFGDNQKVAHSWTIPNNKYLFVPIFNVQTSTLCGNGDTEDELRAVANYYINNRIDWKTAFIKIDGVPIELGDGSSFKIESPLYHFGPLPKNNVLLSDGEINAQEGATSAAVACGYYLMLSPLSVGAHTIEIYTECTWPLTRIIQDATLYIDISGYEN
jgi:hypothetical protein